MFPHFTDEKVESYTLDFAKKELKQVGKIIKKYNHRIIMHPGQYNQVGAIKKDVFERTIKDLKMHADILDYLNVDENGVIIVHGGGVYGNKKKTITRWIEQFKLLPENVKRRLTIEHCERQYNVDDVLYISKKCNIPVIFDTHHYSCYNILHPDEEVSSPKEFLPRIIKSWKSRISVMHISEQGNGRIGHHSDYIEEIPKYLLEFISKNDVKINLEVEAKMKEQAILRLYEKYRFLEGEREEKK